jgi:GNAT superfamily N-acetyltransferase
MPDPSLRIDEESPTSRDAQYCLSEYYRELSRRFATGFDPAQSLSPSLDEFLPPQGSFLVMRLGGKPVGCGGFKRTQPDTAYLKRMWVAPAARGLGLGMRLLEALEERARLRGYRKVQLETNKSLTEAQTLYRRCGYREVPPFNDEPYAHYWFEKSLVESAKA